MKKRIRNKKGQFVAGVHYNSGPTLNKRTGYYRIIVNGERFLYHRYIMEKHLGRKLKREEIIHHKNGDKTNNQIDNLILVESQTKHISDNHHCADEKWLEIEEIRINSKNKWFDVCLVVSCDKKVAAKGLCKSCYRSYRNWYNRFYKKIDG